MDFNLPRFFLLVLFALSKCSNMLKQVFIFIWVNTFEHLEHNSKEIYLHH
jgi:hypothetical protein